MTRVGRLCINIMYVIVRELSSYVRTIFWSVYENLSRRGVYEEEDSTESTENQGKSPAGKSSTDDGGNNVEVQKEGGSHLETDNNNNNEEDDDSTACIDECSGHGICDGLGSTKACVICQKAINRCVDIGGESGRRCSGGRDWVHHDRPTTSACSKDSDCHVCECKSGWIGETCKDPVYPWDADELRSVVRGQSVTSTTFSQENPGYRNFQNFDTLIPIEKCEVRSPSLNFQSNDRKKF